MVNLILTIIGCCLASSLLASEAIHDWHHYDDPIVTPQEQVEQEIEQQWQQLTSRDKLLLLRALTREVLAKAILNPTVENVHQYITLQRYLIDKSTVFAGTWQEALLTHPEDNYLLEHPSESQAIKIKSLERQQQEAEAIQYFTNRFGLLYFYRGKERLDTTLLDTIKLFGNQYHVAVLFVSVDDTLALPNSVKDKGQAKRLNIHHFPALMLVNPKEKKVMPLYYGYFALDELIAESQLIRPYNRSV